MNTTATSASFELPHVFAQPPLVGQLAIGSLLVSVAGAAGSMVIPFLKIGADHGIWAASSLACFLVCLWFSVDGLRRSDETIEVTEEGIVRRSARRPPVAIAWNEIDSVHPQHVMQRLVISDASGERRIAIEYHVENYGTLRSLVMAHAPRRAIADGVAEAG